MKNDIFNGNGEWEKLSVPILRDWVGYIIFIHSAPAGKWVASLLRN